MALYDEKLLKELFEKHYEVTPKYRVAMQQEYFELTEKKIPMPTLRDKVAKYRFSLTKTFNERTDDIIDQPKKLYTSKDLLEAMGVDPDGDLDFDRATVNRWWLDRGDILERIRNGQLKIQLTKKKFELTEAVMNSLLEQANITPLWIDESVDKPSGLFEFTMTDPHFGKNTYADYKPHQDKIMRWIKSKEWQEVLIPIGNDLFHWDNVNGTTTAGTQVGFEPNLEQAWEDAIKFYFPIIEETIRHSVDVYIPYIKGNHDATLGWSFVKMIEKKFPQAIVDTSIDNYKLHTWKKIAIGLSHGNEPKDFKKYSKIFNELFRMELAQAEVREIHLGDKHHQIIHDEFGIVTRGLSTASITDRWHYNNGFIGASKCFQAFIYTEDSIEAMVFI